MRTILLTATLLVLAAGSGIARAGTEMCDDPPCSRRELEAYEKRVVRHVLRTQQARFEAMARGDQKKSARLEREFKRTQQRWSDAKRALANASD
jgi:hypothetical protein